MVTGTVSFFLCRTSYIVKKGMAGVLFGIVARLPAGWSKGLNLGKSEEFFCYKTSRPGLRPTLPPVQRALCLFPEGKTAEE